jgi:phosphate transport system substrate-binding protein
MFHWKQQTLAFSLTLVGTIVAAPLLPIARTIAQDAAPSFPMPSSVPSGTAVKLDGSSSMQMMNDLFKQRFEQKFSGSQINLNTSNSDDAVKALVEDKIDVAALGRPLTTDEKALGLQPAVLAREKIAVIVGANNPFQGNITFAQFAKIFRGEITNWSELGGPDAPIRFIDRPENSDTRRSLSQYPVFAEAPFETGSTAKPVADDTAAVTAELGQDGISYAVASQAMKNADVRVISMHKTLPDDPRYPYSQPRNYVYKAGADGQPSPAAAAFLGYATSPDGQTIVQEAEAAVLGGQPAVTAAPTASPAATGEAVAIAPAAAPAPVATTPAASTELPPWWWLPIAAVAGAGGLLWWFGKRKADVPVAAPAEYRQPVGAGATTRSPEYTGTPPNIGGAVARGAGVAGAAGAAGLGAAAAAKATTPVAPVTPTPVTPTPVTPTPITPIKSVTTVTPTAPATGSGINIGAMGLGAAAVGAAALGAGALAQQATKLSLKPVGDKSLYAAWDIPQARQAELKAQGAETLQLKLHDATMIDLEKQPAHSVDVFDCDELKGDQLIPVARADRDYVGELGYKTKDNGWLSVAKSKTLEMSKGVGFAAGAAGVATAAAIAAQTNTTTKKHPETSHIMLNRPTNTYVLGEEQVTRLTEQASVQQTLQPGHYTLKIKEGQFSYRPLAEHPGEAMVMLWLKGGKLIGDRAQVETQDTWLTLNGYGDEYKVQILEPTTLYAFFIDTHKDDNAGEVTVKVTKD